MGEPDKTPDPERESDLAELRELVVEVVKDVLPDFLTGNDDLEDDDTPATRGDLARAQSEMASAMEKLQKAPKVKAPKAATPEPEVTPEPPEPQWKALTKKLWGAPGDAK
jgi:hypothetical protein